MDNRLLAFELGKSHVHVLYPARSDQRQHAVEVSDWKAQHKICEIKFLVRYAYRRDFLTLSDHSALVVTLQLPF